jgi:SAM-dependent methyltransferase
LSATGELFRYSGNELDIFAAARNWRQYWSRQVEPFLGQRVLELGSGIGSVTQALWHPSMVQWIALEPDEALCRRLADSSFIRAAHAVQVRCGTVSTLMPGTIFDTALYIDVLEHIEDDGAELLRVARHIGPGGHIIVLAPAHQWLFTEFDAAIGHHRRYTMRALRRIGPPGFAPVRLRYLDSVGLLASLANRLMLRTATPSPRQIAIWDRGMVPLSRAADGLFGYRIGKSILAVWQRIEPGAAG